MGTGWGVYFKRITIIMKPKRKMTGELLFNPHGKHFLDDGMSFTQSSWETFSREMVRLRL
jgi:hypothetical protein